MEVSIRPAQRVLHVQPGANLLEVLRQHHVPISYSCTDGRCGTCRCKVVSGAVLDGGKESQRPLEGDLRLVLACQTFLMEPCTIEVLDSDEVVVQPARTVKATVSSIEDMTRDIKRLLLTPAKRIAFSPGQHVQLQFAPGHGRPFSVASLPGEGSLEFHVRLIPQGRVTGYIANMLRVGDTVHVSGPLGSSYLRRRPDGPILCVAASTGLAPVLSILRGTVAASMTNPIHLYVSARSPRDIYGLDWLRQIGRRHPALHVQVVVTSRGAPSEHRIGLVTDAIEADWPDLTGWRAYLFGSAPTVEAATLLVRRIGIAPERVFAEAFFSQGV